MPVPKSSLVPGQQHTEFFQTIYPGVSQNLDFSGVDDQFDPIGEGTTIIRIFSTQDCFIRRNAAADAIGGMFIPGGIIDFIGVEPGDVIHVIRSASDGTLYITEGE